jgi:hypothetical protein
LTRYTISYKTKFGNVSAESENPEDLILAQGKLRNLASSIRNGTGKKNVLKKKPVISSDGDRVGSGETATVLREIENRILESNFFSGPKTTGETREKLHSLTGKYYTSRKVSQALGILRDKRKLTRAGKRNFFVYSVK